ncbi:DUF1653 domain-containing protein [Peredibacter sp. HCB2-198]|uniref:DUF1653 domain-containing protein n=1 Tax=Peredibacter sp. HCB2-198 TaxID=3383025 RepID=UPI0038B5505C
MVEDLVLGGVYQHYKGKNYLVRDLARHSETMEWMVLYECLYENEEGRLWVRPLKMFLETIELDGKTVPRFKYIGDQKGRSRL